MANAISTYLEVILIGIGIFGILVFGFLFFPKVIGGLSTKAPESFRMIAELKGSTYGPGDVISVFGTCRDMNGKSIAADAYFSVRYPNGTVMLADDIMIVTDVGVYLWSGTMNSVSGTYLTSMRCEYNGMSAIAYGEWQNPLWARQIEQGLIVGNDTNLRVQALQYDVSGLNDTLVMINQTVVNQHNVTRTYIADQFNATNQLIQFAAETANGSVDRNNSLLYTMLHYLLIKAGYPITGNVTAVPISASPEVPVYYADWTITAGVVDEYNRTIAYPDVECFMSSNLAPTFRMTPVGQTFIGTVFIDTLADNLSISVDCNRIIY